MCNDATVIIENNEVLATIVIDNNCEQFTIIASGLGTPGLSAYDIAVANGFIGTEAQWIASLQVSKTSDLINDGADGVHPFITLEDIPSVTVSDATTTTKGIIKLAGDLSGTADLPTVPNKVDKVTGYSLTKNDLTDLLKAAYDSAVTWISTNGATLISHLTNYSNPHQTTAAQVGAYTTTQTDTLLNGKVPYTGATANVDLGEFQLKAGQLEFDQTPTGTAGVGKLVWNDTDGTLDLGLKGGNVTLQVGQEQVLRVVNKTATNISLLESNYQAVRVTGAQGQRLKVDLALATNDLLSAETIGLVTETIANNQEGFITTSGLIRGINTTGSLQGETWVDGDVIYLSPTTAGNVTNIKPIAPNHLIIIGYVVSAHITQGTIFVKVDNGYELNELHNVKIDTPLDAEVLGYENSTSLWKNKSIATWLGFTPSNDANVVHITSTETITGSKTFLPSVTASSAIARGTYIAPTLVATANNDVLVGLDIAPTFTSGSFTRLSLLSARFNGNVLMGQVPNSLIAYSYVPLTLSNNAQGVLKTQLSLVNAGGNAGAGSAIDFFTYTDAGNGLPGARIASIDNGSYSANIQFLTKANTYGGTGALTVKFQLFGTTGNISLQDGGTFTDLPSARLQVNSTTQGFLPPRMTNAQRIAIVSPAIGLMVYCTDAVEGVYVYKSTGWTFIG